MRAALVAVAKDGNTTIVTEFESALYLHVIDVPDAEAADEFRRTALDLEQRLLRALPPRPVDREDP